MNLFRRKGLIAVRIARSLPGGTVARQQRQIDGKTAFYPLKIFLRGQNILAAVAAQCRGNAHPQHIAQNGALNVRKIRHRCFMHMDVQKSGAYHPIFGVDDASA